MATILIIDDEPAILDNLTDLLEGEGYDVLAASDGAEGLERARTGYPDLVLCDVRMPGLSGHDVLAALRADPALAPVPFIFLTANADLADLRQGMNGGADDYLTKPYTIDDVLTAIDARLERQRSVVEPHERTVQALQDGLVQSVPHELRTPLVGVIGLSQVLREDWKDMDAGLVDSMLDDIFRSGQRLERLIENTTLHIQLDQALADPASDQRYGREWTPNVEAAATDVAERVAARYGREADLVTDLAPGSVRMSRYLLEKTLTELVDNAFRFSDATVRVAGRTEGDRYVLEIADRGRGMTEAQVAAIGPFLQFDRAEHEQQGLGLGLSIARRLTTLHHGTLGIESRRGEGTTVRCALPR